MDCPKCSLRFNTINRKPKVHKCGHTLCDTCSNKLLACATCNMELDKSKFTLNHSLMEMLNERKVAKDIDKLVKMCFVGESTVGKTSLISRLKGEQYRENTVTTIGYDFSFEDRVIDELTIRFQLWDSAGQEKYRAVSPLHYKNSDILVIVYDVTQDSNNNNVGHWIDQANSHCPVSCKKMLVGNKIDLLQSLTTMHNKPVDSSTWKIAASQKIFNYPVSCKTYEGIEQFWSIIENTMRSILKKDAIQQNSVNDHQYTKSNGKSKSTSSADSVISALKLKKTNQYNERYRQSNCNC